METSSSADPDSGPNDYRWVLPFSAVLGAILLVCADIGARYIIMPQEVPVGVMTAIIGMPEISAGPFFGRVLLPHLLP